MGAFLLANRDSDSHNPIFVSPFHLSESEMRFESKESTPNSGFFGFNFNLDSDSPFRYPFHCTHAQCSLENSSCRPTDRTPQVRVVLLFEFVFKRTFLWDRNEIGQQRELDIIIGLCYA